MRVKSSQSIHITEFEIRQLINVNGDIRNNYILLLKSIAASLKQQIAS
jgi:hypothetical protein